MLEKIDSGVITNYRIPISTKPDDLWDHPRYRELKEIYSSLNNYRGYSEFVRASYVDVDFFLPQQRIIVEFDESQHFTEPRRITLSLYPNDLKLGFSPEKWKKCCNDTQAHDENPPFRDEQRAWYDTIRDFLPEMKGLLPTVRLSAKDREWCSLDPKNSKDMDFFIRLVKKKPSQAEKPDVLEEFIRFEYLLNMLKIQYLLDCASGEFNYESKYFIRNAGNPKILNSGGNAFKVYLNIRFQFMGYQGPLFKDIDPWQYEIVKELDQVNDRIK